MDLKLYIINNLYLHESGKVFSYVGQRSVSFDTSLK